MAISFLSPRFYWLLNLGVCQLYPAYKTFLYLYGTRLGLTKTTENPALKSVFYAHHFVYWALYLLYSYVESLFPFHKVVPLYYELKLIFFFWLGSDHFKGAGYLFQTYLAGFVNEFATRLTKFVDANVEPKTKAMLLDLLKNLGTFGDSSEPSEPKESRAPVETREPKEPKVTKPAVQTGVNKPHGGHHKPGKNSRNNSFDTT